MLEYTSGRTFARLGIDLPPPTTEAGVSKKAKTGKKKKKKKKHGAVPVADAAGVVAKADQDVPEPPEPGAR